MPKNTVEAKNLNQILLPLAIDMAPAQPHTNQKKARTCENCHTRLKTAGLGLEKGILNSGTRDWSKITTTEGIQLTTVGSHWPLSRAFNQSEIQRLLKPGTCMGCHTNMSEPSFWKKVAKKETLDSLKHSQLMNQALKKLGRFP